MNPQIFQNCQVRALPTVLSHPHLAGPYYLLEIKFGPDGEPHRFPSTFVSPDALARIDANEVKGLSIETLADNSLASQRLGSAQHLVTGIELHDGTIVRTIPSPLLKDRQNGLLLSTAVAALSAIWSVAIAPGAIATCLLLAATHAFRTYAAIPNAAFPGLEIHAWFDKNSETKTHFFREPTLWKKALKLYGGD